MRGGAIPLLAWGTLNLVLLVLNWVWEGAGIHVGLFAFTVVVVYLGALALALARGRRVLRRGAPEYVGDPEALPRVSFAAAGVGVAIALAAFGLVFGTFLIVVGGVLLALCLGRLLAELRWQRRATEAVRREHSR